MRSPPQVLALWVALGAGGFPDCADPPPPPRAPRIECNRVEDCEVLAADRGYDAECTQVECVEDCADESCQVKDQVCSFTAIHEAAACADESPCTVEDTCADKACVGVPKACIDGHPCTSDGNCDPATGACLNPVTLGLKCDDGIDCTAPDECDADGLCMGQPTEDCECAFNTDCAQLGAGFRCGCNHACLEDTTATTLCDPAQGTDCSRISCNTKTGLCDLAPLEDGVPCTSPNRCIPAASCLGGECVGVPKACDDGDPCTSDACQPATAVCVWTPFDCNDKLPCTLDGCEAGKCVHTPQDQECDDDQPCTEDRCDPVLGCKSQPVTDPKLVAEICQTSELTCAIAACANSGCVIESDASLCAAPGCHQTLACQGWVCTYTELSHSAADAVCDDLSQCSSAACSFSTGKCEVTPLTCHDEDLCTDDSCDPSSGCTFTPNCADDKACTAESCDPATGKCIKTSLCGEVDGNPGTKPCCASTGCLEVPNAQPCPN
jgi:hypothetical protein